MHETFSICTFCHNNIDYKDEILQNKQQKMDFFLQWKSITIKFNGYYHSTDLKHINMPYSCHVLIFSLLFLSQRFGLNF